MDHETIQEKLIEYRNGAVSQAEKLEISSHLEKCQECGMVLKAWEQMNPPVLKKHIQQTGEWFVHQTMNRIEALETAEPEPKPRWALPKWLVPVLGYSLAFFLMYLAIEHRELPITTESVLISDVPQNSQWAFSSDSPDTEILSVSQEGL